jgi:hypothetical protein
VVKNYSIRKEFNLIALGTTLFLVNNDLPIARFDLRPFENRELNESIDRSL